MGGCATVKHPSPADPWEGYNRSMYRFNETMDGAVLKPVSPQATRTSPRVPMRTCIRNVFNNLGDVWSAANSLLQGRGHDFFNTLGRVLFNSTMGLGGCIDVASMNGAPRIANDFGVTLGVWGFESGPYVVLPFLGPSTVRDGIARRQPDGAGASSNAPSRFSPSTTYRCATPSWACASWTPAPTCWKPTVWSTKIALDRYSFIRDAYLQRRKAMVDQRRHHPGQPSNVSDDLNLTPGDHEPARLRRRRGRRRCCTRRQLSKDEPHASHPDFSLLYRAPAPSAGHRRLAAALGLMVAAAGPGATH